MKTAAAAALVAAFFVSMAGCFGQDPVVIIVKPRPTPTPIYRGTPVPGPTETPTPGPGVIEPGTRGRAVLEHTGIDRLVFGYDQWTPGALDYYVLATLMGQEGSRAMPVVELSLRGNFGDPCTSSRGCDLRQPHPGCLPSEGIYVREQTGRCWNTQLVGLWLRASGNPAYEGQGKPFHGACGFTEEHALGARQPIPPDALSRGVLRTELQWAPHGIRYRAEGRDWSPWLELKHSGSIILAHLQNGVPPGGVGFALPGWSASLWGVTTRIVSWEAETAPEEPFIHCPPEVLP